MLNLNRFGRYVKIFLVVLPFLYLIIGFYFRFLLGNLSLLSIDPDYVYFISGLQISEGFFKVGHIDHPGTPLQVFIALVFRTVYLFRNHQVPFIEDVFSNSDMYLSIVNVAITSLTSVLLYYSGRKVFQYTNSIFYAILVQTTPFLPVIWYDLVGRVVPELMLPFPIILLSVVIIKIYFGEDKVTNKLAIGLALLAALGLAIKLTFLPIFLIPFLIIKGWKHKIIFIGATILSFFIFALPVTLQFQTFWGWIKNLFIHSGQYGGGDTNFIDFTAFRNSIQELFNYEKGHFYILFGLILLFIIYIILNRKKAEKKVVVLTSSVILTIGFIILLVGKHYAHHYFIPALMLSPLVVILIAELLKKMIPEKLATYIIPIGIIAYLAWTISNNHQWLPIKSTAIGTNVNIRLNTWHVAQTLEKDSYKIIASQAYGCPFVEYTLVYSTVWANYKKREEYYQILAKLYPNTYNYFTWDNTLRYWGEKFNTQKVIESGKPIYLYLERNEEEIYNRTISKLNEENGSPVQINRELIYLNPKTTEIIYQLTFDRTILNDAEQTSYQ